jgi:prefoldin subunit 5
VKEYSTFIDTKLHPELKKRVDAREQVEEEIADYRDLSTKLKALVAQQDDSPLEAMVDLGHDTVYCRGVASPEQNKPLMMHVHVGMGFHAELTIPEALAFSEKRILYLEQILKKRVEASTMVARHIESSLLILEQLAREKRDYN